MIPLVRFIRSRRVAVWLMGGLTAYSLLMTWIPQGPVDSARVAAWRASHPMFASVTAALGLHNAWWWPPFVLAAAFLGLSTAVCAWERTASAVLQWKRWHRPEEAQLQSLVPRDSSAVVLELDMAAAYARVEGALRSARMSFTRTGHGVWARSRTASVFGSPVFHWGLFALVALTVLGQATRWDGRMGAVVGLPQRDVAVAYGSVQRGPFASKSAAADRQFLVSRVETQLAVGDAFIGNAADVAIYEKGRLVARKLVYPNHVLTHGITTVHLDGVGLGAVITVLAPQGEALVSGPVYFDFESVTDGGRVYSEGVLLRGSDREIPVRMAIRLDRDRGGTALEGIPARPILEFVFPRTTDGSFADTLSAEASVSAVPVGSELVLPGGRGSVRVDKIDYYARLNVVEDWSLIAVYVALLVVSVSAAVALLVPPRAVWVSIEAADAPSGCIVHIVPRCRRIDPAFPERIRDRITKALGADESAVANAEPSSDEEGSA